jgi:hypothetical protein
MKNLLLFLFLITTIILLLRSLGLLPANTTRTSTSEWRAKGEIDVLLRIETNDEGWDVDDLLANTDVSLADEDTGVVDGLGETELVDTGLQTTLQEILNLQGQHVIELHAGLVEDTDTDKTANEGVSFEKTLWVLLVEGKKLTGGTTNLGQGELDTPDLTLWNRVSMHPLSLPEKFSNANGTF